jgi:hypothetical protein
MFKNMTWSIGFLIIIIVLLLNSGEKTFSASTVIERTELISASTSGVQGSGGSTWADMTPDGRYIVFQSNAENLVADDTNGKIDVFRHDRESGETIRVSVATDGTQADGDSILPSISDDGRYVVFESSAGNLISNSERGGGIYMRDVVGETTVLISVDSDEIKLWYAASNPHISGDGTTVAFEYWHAENIKDIYVRDLTAGTTTLVSIATDGTQSDAWSKDPKLSRTGRFVAFMSNASIFAPGDELNTWDVFVHDRTTGITIIVSVSSDGVIGRYFCPDLTGASFASNSDNLSQWSLTFRHRPQIFGPAKYITTSNSVS